MELSEYLGIGMGVMTGVVTYVVLHVACNLLDYPKTDKLTRFFAEKILSTQEQRKQNLNNSGQLENIIQEDNHNI